MSSETLALFDLDHTLIPFDSGMAWTQFLVRRGVLPAEAQAHYLACCQRFVAGTLDIHAMHRECLRPIVHHPRAALAQWQREFEAEMARRVPAAMRALVQRHRDEGDLCAIVTATTQLIAEPFARVFGIDMLLATQAATAAGSFTGEIDGDPCYREHKLTRVERWLASRSPQSPATLAAFERSWCYSDSISDLPLLSAVTHPVAVRPDERLRAHALRCGWRILDAQ